MMITIVKSPEKDQTSANAGFVVPVGRPHKDLEAFAVRRAFIVMIQPNGPTLLDCQSFLPLPRLAGGLEPQTQLQWS